MPPLSATFDGAFLGAGIEAIYAGVDWLSCTLPTGSPREQSWLLTCIHLIDEVEDMGYEREVYSRNGYDGVGAGGCFVGTRDDGTYLQLSGHHAGDLLDRITRDDLHISRLDIQTTVKYREYAPGVGKVCYDDATDANGTLPASRRRRIWYMAGNDGGWTTYIGAPTSEQRAKVYNKAVQSNTPEYERCWRWEVTAKNDYATAWYRRVIAEENTRPALCASIVASWFALRGITPVWAPYIRLIALPLIKEVPSDAEKKLSWLKAQVRPALRWLIDNGFNDEALKALGIMD